MLPYTLREAGKSMTCAGSLHNVKIIPGSPGALILLVLWSVQVTDTFNRLKEVRRSAPPEEVNVSHLW